MGYAQKKEQSYPELTLNKKEDYPQAIKSFVENLKKISNEISSGMGLEFSIEHGKKEAVIIVTSNVQTRPVKKRFGGLFSRNDSKIMFTVLFPNDGIVLIDIKSRFDSISNPTEREIMIYDVITSAIELGKDTLIYKAFKDNINIKATYDLTTNTATPRKTISKLKFNLFCDRIIELLSEPYNRLLRHSDKDNLNNYYSLDAEDRVLIIKAGNSGSGTESEFVAGKPIQIFISPGNNHVKLKDNLKQKKQQIISEAELLFGRTNILKGHKNIEVHL